MNLRSRLLNALFAATAGLVGGLIPHFLLSEPSWSQAAVAPEPEREIRAEHFSVVNDQGKLVGAFGIDSSGGAVINIYDVQGRRIWSTQAGPVPIAK